MTTLHKHLLRIAAAGALSMAAGVFAVSAEEAVVLPEATTEAPAVAPEVSTDETTTEIAPSSGTGTAEEPAYSVTPSEGPGGGCRGHKGEDPSV